MDHTIKEIDEQIVRTLNVEGEVVIKEYPEELGARLVDEDGGIELSCRVPAEAVRNPGPEAEIVTVDGDVPIIDFFTGSDEVFKAIERELDGRVRYFGPTREAPNPFTAVVDPESIRVTKEGNDALITAAFKTAEK